MRLYFIDQLVAGKWISDDQYRHIREWLKHKPFSLHWELRILLYAGVLLVTSGIGIIIYENIETIGHTAIIILIGIACTGCFWYCISHREPYSHHRIIYPSPWFDYVLLLGCLLFLALEGYLQYQYNLFGTRYGLATLVPALLFLALAYLFDHAGVLSMGITAFASFAGVTVNPGFLLGNDLSESTLIHTGILLSALLIGVGYILKEQDIKRHFTFTYYNFGFNMYFLCVLAALMTLQYPFIYFGLLMAGCILLVRYAVFEKSFYFLLLSVVYGYIGCTWVIFQFGLDELFGLGYFVFSCVLVIWFFLNYKKILKLN